MAAGKKQPVVVTGLGSLDKPAGAALTWIDARFPLMSNWREHMSEYYAPKNFNFWYFFGSLAMLVLVIQIVTGIFLAMHYKPDADKAFQSVEYIMREVPWGWLIRYMHSTGASMFFIVVYLHMFRGLLYGSYRKPRELVWMFGVMIFLCLMGEAFFGYLLPWGQMSYWGAQVIVNLFGAIPVIGPDLSIWIRGDYVVSDATLNRFFSFHVIAIPLVLLGLVAAHILALHEVGSNNPDGVEIKEKLDDKGIPLDGIPFHPYYTIGHDLFAAVVFLIVFSVILFFLPEMGGYFLEVQQLHPGRLAQDAAAHRAGLVLHAVLLDPARDGVEFPLHRRQGVGRDRDGRLHPDLFLPALAGPLAGQVDPLSPDPAQVLLRGVRDLLFRARLPGHAAAHRRPHPGVADLHGPLLRLFPRHAVVEPHGRS